MNKFREIYKADMSDERPSAELLEKTIAAMDGRNEHSTGTSHRFLKLSLVIIVLSILITTAVAASWYFFFLKPSEIANLMGDEVLSAAFEDGNVININESITSDGYTFTLLAIMSGKDLEDKVLFGNSDEASEERTYAVVAIRHDDESKLVDEYGFIRTPELYISPMVKGLKPWLVNIGSLHGSAFARMVDGVIYYIVECDTVEIFADRGLYLVMCKGGPIYDSNAIIYDEETGEISANPEYGGPCAVFDLPLDKSLANPEKAEEYLNSINYYYVAPDPEELYLSDANIETGPSSNEEWLKWSPEDRAEFCKNIDWDQAVPVPSTLEELTVGKDGIIAYLGFIDYYSWGGPPVSGKYSDYFEDNQTAQSKIVEMRLRWDSDGTAYTIQGIRFSMDETGKMTGVVIEIPSENDSKDEIVIPPTIAEYYALTIEEQIEFRMSIDWSKGVPVEGSLKEVSVGADGMATYSWAVYDETGKIIDGGGAEFSLGILFVDNGTSQSRMSRGFSIKELDDGKLQSGTHAFR